MALLAFEPTTGPGVAASGAPEYVATLLLPSQRQRTANELNTAILESQSQNKESKLIGLIRLLGWGEGMLQERAEFPKVRMQMAVYDAATEV